MVAIVCGVGSSARLRTVLLMASIGMFVLSAALAPGAHAQDDPISTVDELITAIEDANASGDPTTITLADNHEFALFFVNSATTGPTGLPVITGEITIEGNGSTIRRSSESETPLFRIFHVGPTGGLELNDLTIHGGSMSGWRGGGILNQGELTIIDSTVSGNAVTTNHQGGGIANDDGTVTLISSTVSGNSSAQAGGGIATGTGGGSGSVTLINSTVGSNSVSGAVGGGGIWVNSTGTATLINSTVSGNSAAHANAFGGGIIIISSGSVTLTGSLVAGNSAQTSPDITGTVQANSSYNLVGNGDFLTGISNGDSNNNIVGVDHSDVLSSASLSDNGGPTETIALIDDPDNPAIDHIPEGEIGCADDQASQPVVTDQRGVERPQGDRCDIGAFELNGDVDGDPDPLDRIYVDGSNAGEAQDGASWVTAFSDLQDGLDLASFSTGTLDSVEIWVASGPYYPTDGSNRSASFSIPDGVTLYGGFPSGGGDGTFDARDPENNVTTLSGNLGDQSTNSQNSYTVVRIGNGITATIDGVTITGGNANGSVGVERGGGGIHTANGGTAVLIDSIVSGNQSGYVGGGIWNFGTVELISSTVTDNTSGIDGAGIYNDAGVVTLTGNSSIHNNTAEDSGGGIVNFRGLVTVSSSTVSDNEAAFDGGGIYNNAGEVILTDSSVNNNESDREGGGIYIDGSNASITVTNSTVTGNQAGYGGGILNFGGEVILTNSTLSENRSGNSGAGIFNLFAGTVTLTNSIVSNNDAAITGGGIRNGNSGEVTLVNSIVSGNEATLNGGGIRSGDNGEVTLINSVVSGNAVTGTSSIGGGGIHNNPSGGEVTLINSTVAGNRVDDGAGGGIRNDAGPLTLTNSIVWGNSTSDIDGGGTTTVHHAIIESGNVACDPSDHCFADDPLFIDWIDPAAPGWEPNSDGDYRLLPGSPAIDAGDDDAYDVSEFGNEGLDGNSRFVGAAIDLGAYEAQFTNQSLSLAAPPEAVVGSDATVTVTLTADGFDPALAEGATVMLSGHNGDEEIVLDNLGEGSTTVTTTTLGSMELGASFGTLSDETAIEWIPGDPASIEITVTDPVSAEQTVGQPVTATAAVTDALGHDVADGTEVTFSVDRNETASIVNGDSWTVTTSGGAASIQYTNTLTGIDNITATAGGASETLDGAVTWIPAAPHSIVVSVDPGEQTVGQAVTVTATVTDEFGNDVVDGVAVVVDIAGSHAEEPTRTDGGSGFVAFTSSGQATLEYTRFFPGIDTITASAGDEPDVITSAPVTVEWILPAPTYGISVTARHLLSFQTTAAANPRGGVAGMITFRNPGVHFSTREVTTVVVDGNQAIIYGLLNDGRHVRIDLVRGPNTARVRLADYDSGVFQVHQVQFR